MSNTDNDDSKSADNSNLDTVITGDLSDEEITDTVETYQDIMGGVGYKTALEEFDDADIDIESLSDKQKYLITNAPFRDGEIQYESKLIEAGTIGELREREIMYLRRREGYQDSLVDLTRIGLLYRAVLLTNTDFDSEHTYVEKVEMIR